MKIFTRHLLISCLTVSGCVVPETDPACRHAAPVREKVKRDRPNAPHLKRLRNGHYRVTAPWTVDLNGRTWRIPSGYSTNGITGPAWLGKALGNGVNHPETWAAVFHDWLFTQPGMSRAEADRIFRDLLVAYSVPPMKAQLMYSGVSAYSASKTFR